MKKEALSDRDTRLIKKYLMGGAALGTGTALVTSLINHMNNLYKDTKEDTSQDDNLSVINLPARQKSAALGAGAAGAAGALSLMGGYMLTRKVYQEMRKKQLQKQIDQAQQLYMDELLAEEETNKAASAMLKAADGGKPIGLLEGSAALPVSAALLLALASGSLTNHMLSKTFPAPKQPMFKRPRRIVVRRAEEDEKGEVEKTATFSGDDFDGMDYLAAVVSSQPGFEKKSQLLDLAGAVASGRAAEFYNVSQEIGTDAAFAVIKGASAFLTEESRPMAFAAAARNSLVGPTYQTLLAAEALEMMPTHTKAAAVMDADVERSLFALGCWAGAQIKHAAVTGNALNELPPELIAELEATLTANSPEELDLFGDAQAKGVEGQDEESQGEGANDDIIDIVMSDNKEAAPALA